MPNQSPERTRVVGFCSATRFTVSGRGSLILNVRRQKFFERVQFRYESIRRVGVIRSNVYWPVRIVAGVCAEIVNQVACSDHYYE